MFCCLHWIHFMNETEDNIDIKVDYKLEVNYEHPADWSAFGEGNITAAPKLSKTGWLLADSPCIDTGTDINFIARDLDGVTRTAGLVDIGCREFVDSDGDGIPDHIETAAGLNPNDPADAQEDLDNDGINNLEEYRLGTNIASADSDGDGIADNVEIAQNYDPTCYTRITYVNNSTACSTFITT